MYLKLKEESGSRLGFNEYQKFTHSTAIYPDIGGSPLVYPVLELNGEAGELADKLKKVFRDKNGVLLRKDIEGMALEAGDCLYAIAQIANHLGYTLEEIAQMNMDKLQKRKVKGKIKGSGDDR